MNMSLSELIPYFESVKFAVDINILSGLNLLVHVLNIHERVGELVNLLKTSPETSDVINKRIEALIIAYPPESPNLHPEDSALAAYIFALENSETPASDETLSSLAHNPTLWWSKRLAGRYLSERHPAPLEPVGK